MAVQHYFILRGTDKTVPEEQVRRELGKHYDEIVQAGIAICVENKCEEVRTWMVEDYAHRNKLPTVLTHFYWRRLADEWKFRYPHFGSVDGSHASFTFEPQGILLKDVEINGVKYAGIRIKLSNYTTVTLYDGSSDPIQKDYYDLLPTKHT